MYTTDRTGDINSSPSIETIRSNIYFTIKIKIIFSHQKDPYIELEIYSILMRVVHI